MTHLEWHVWATRAAVYSIGLCLPVSVARENLDAGLITLLHIRVMFVESFEMN